MAKYKVFLHGVPVGHEICGATTDIEREYLRQFYGMKTDTPTVMRTDIVNGVAYYSYLRKNYFSNAEGRSGSYFCITISPGKFICKDVQTLYTILEETYKRICVGSLVRDDANGGSFLVREMDGTMYQGYAITDYIQAVVEQNVDKLIDKSLMESIEDNVNTQGTVKFSLSEVNSPRFIEAMLSRTVLISPAFETASKAYDTLLNKYNALETVYVRSKEEANRLKEELRSLEKSYADQQKEATKADKRHNEELDAVKKELADTKGKLDRCENEKSGLENKLKQAKSTIEKIIEPYKQLADLLAPQPQGTHKTVPTPGSADSPKSLPKGKLKTGLTRSDYVLLLLVLALAVAALLLFTYR